MAEALTIALILEAKDNATEWIDRVRENVDKLARSAEEASKKVSAGADQMSTSLEKTDVASTNAAESMDREAVASDRAAEASRNQATASDEATVATDKQAESTTVLGDKSEETSGKMAMLSKASNMVGLALLGVAVVSAKLAIDFQNSTATLAGQAGVSVQTANKIGNAFLAMGGQTEFSATQMMNAFAPVGGQFVTMYGHALDVSQSVKFMDAAMTLATASGSDLNSTVSGLASTMMVFHLKVGQASQAANVLFNTSRLLGISQDTLGTSMARLAPKIAGSGMSLAQLGGVMLEVGKTAGSGRTAIRSVGTIIAGLVSPSTSAQTTLGELGITLDNSKGKFIGMTAAIGKIHDALAKLPGTTKDVVQLQQMYKLQTQEITLGQETQTKEVKKQVSTLNSQITALGKSTKSLSDNTVMTTLFGKSAGLMANIVAGGVPALNAATAAAGKQGEASKAAAIKNATFDVQLKKLKSAAETIFIELGRKLLPVLTKMATKMVDVVNATIKWVQHNQTLTEVIGGLVIGILAAVKVIETITVLTKAWAAAQVILDALFVASPFGLVVVAILAVVAVAILLIKYWRDIYNAGYDTRVALEAAWGAVASWFKSTVIEPVVTFFKTLWDDISGAATATWHAITAVWDAVASWFNSNVIQPVVGFFKGQWDTISAGATTAWHVILAVWDAVASWFNTNVIQPIENFFTGLWDKIVAGAKTVVSDIEAPFKAIAGFVSGIFGGALSTNMAGVSTKLKGVATSVQQITQAAQKATKALKDTSTASSKLSTGGSVSTKHLKRLAAGGLVSSPTLAMVGEAGPEMVIPLSQIGGPSALSGGVSPLPSGSSRGSSGSMIQVNITLAGQVYGSLEQLANALGRQLATITIPGAGTRLSTR